MKTKYNHLKHSYLLIIALSMAIFSCIQDPLGMMRNNDRTSSDEEAEKRDMQLREKIEKKGVVVEGTKKNIATARGEQENLGLKNERLRTQISNREGDVNRVLRQLHDDSASDRDLQRRGYRKCTFHVDCRKCGRSVEVTFARFKELVSKYRTGYTPHEQYRWFLWWEWNRHVTGYTFHQCFRCMTESDISSFEKDINKNADELAALEAKLVIDELVKSNAEELIEDLQTDKRIINHQSERRQVYRERANKAEEEIELLQEQNRQQKIEMAQKLLAIGRPRAEVMAITELTEAELIAIQNFNN